MVKKNSKKPKKTKAQPRKFCTFLHCWKPAITRRYKGFGKENESIMVQRNLCPEHWDMVRKRRGLE